MIETGTARVKVQCVGSCILDKPVLARQGGRVGGVLRVLQLLEGTCLHSPCCLKAKVTGLGLKMRQSSLTLIIPEN